MFAVFACTVSIISCLVQIFQVYPLGHNVFPQNLHLRWREAALVRARINQIRADDRCALQTGVWINAHVHGIMIISMSPLESGYTCGYRIRR